MHPFEQRGLGLDPFTATAVRQHTFQAAPGEPVRAGTCCDYCLQAIRHAVHVVSADGREFKVGLDCARKVDTVLTEQAADIQSRQRMDDRNAVRDELREISRTHHEKLRATPGPEGFKTLEVYIGRTLHKAAPVARKTLADVRRALSL